MVSKKFAIFFTVLIFLIALSCVGMFFALIRLRAESYMVFVQRLEERVAAYRQPHYSAQAGEIVSHSQFFAGAVESRGTMYLTYIGRYTPVFYNMGDDYPKEIQYLHIVGILDRYDDWKLVHTAAGEKWIRENWLPGEVLLSVPGFNQQSLGLPTGCEIVALAMLINKYNEVSVFDLIYEMPRSYDPLLGFRGDPFTRGGLTILPPALLEMTERHVGSAIDMTGATIEDLKAQLAIGRPVLTWLRGMFGFTVHVITLTGYNQYGFFYNDPWLGGINEFISYEDFLAMWEDPIRDLRLHRVYPPRIALSY